MCASGIPTLFSHTVYDCEQALAKEANQEMDEVMQMLQNSYSCCVASFRQALNAETPYIMNHTHERQTAKPTSTCGVLKLVETNVWR